MCHDRTDNEPELIASDIHPIRVAAVEAMRWIGAPIAACDLVEMHEGPLSLSLAVYHMNALASTVPVVDLYNKEILGGATRKLYYLRGCIPASEVEAAA
jgi:hypothetical protein